MMLNKRQKDKEYRQLYYESQSMKINVIQKKFSKSQKKKAREQTKSKFNLLHM